MGEFLETRHDKFIFTVKTGYFYTKEDFWANVDNDQAVVGVSDFLQKVKGDVVFLETIESGTTIKQGQEIGKIETIKTTFAILSPVSGKVVEVNAELDALPNLINESPYGTGWIYRVELDDFGMNKKTLLQADAYFKLMKDKIAEEVKKK
jgi:glycine cleavage system H protein